MKLAISAKGEGLKAEVDQRFGRCSHFVILETETGELVESISNEAASATGGAGPQAAQQLSKHGVNAVVLGNVGPNAIEALNAAKIAVYTGVEGTVEDTFEKYKAGKLTTVDGATVKPHSGMK